MSGTIPRNYRPATTADLNGSHDFGYDESGQILPPPMGFESKAEADALENAYLIPESKFIESHVGRGEIKKLGSDLDRDHSAVKFTTRKS